MDDIDLQIRKIAALEIIIISFAGLYICSLKLFKKLFDIIAVAAAVNPKNKSFI